MERWACCHNADRDFRGIPFTQTVVELPSPAMRAGEQAYELDATTTTTMTSTPNSASPTVLEPLDETVPSIRESSLDWPLRTG